MKYCKKGDHWLSFSDFNKRSDGPGLRAHCKKCCSKANIKRHQEKTGKKRKPAISKEEKHIRAKLACKKYNATPQRKAKQAFYEATRRARLLQATPKWLTPIQLACIEAHYECSHLLSAMFNEKMEVDHIVPLKGKLVSGLHVPWNLQVMCREANGKKSNKFNYG